MNTKVVKKWRGYCINCGYGELKMNARRFCSRECHRDYTNKRSTTLLEAGQYPPTRQNHGFIRKHLVRKLGMKCSRCGWAQRHPKTGNVPVEVEHIDGNWRTIIRVT